MRDDKSVFFSNKRGYRDRRIKSQRDRQNKLDRRNSQLERAFQDWGKNPDEEKNNQRRNDICYNSGKKSHFVKDCRFRWIEENAVTSIIKENDSEEEWDF